MASIRSTVLDGSSRALSRVPGPPPRMSAAATAGRSNSTTVLPDATSTLYVGETINMAAWKRAAGTGRFENACEYRLDRDGRRIVVIADGTTIATESAFDWSVRVRVELDGASFFEREWRERIARDLL